MERTWRIGSFAICGLNPHAGEYGKLGSEDVEVIQPACVILQKEGGLRDRCGIF